MKAPWWMREDRRARRIRIHPVWVAWTWARLRLQRFWRDLLRGAQ